MIDPVAAPRKAYIFNPFLHPDLLVWPASGMELVPGRLLPASGQEIRPGAGAYTGLMAHHLGVSVEYLDWVGDDVFGELTLSQVRAAGHGTGLVRRYEGDHMVCVAVAGDTRDDATMIATYPSAWRRRLEDFEPLVRAIPADSLVYVYSWLWSFAHPELESASTADLLIEAVRVNRLQLLIDPNWKPANHVPPGDLRQLRAALGWTRTLLPNRRDAEELVGAHEPVDLVRRLLDLGPAVVVLKDGAAGAYVATREEPEVVRVPALTVAPRDTTGAGDYFGGAYLAAGGGAVSRTAFAIAAAGLAISRPKGHALPGREEIEAQGQVLLERAWEVR
ncbi:MAG: PfkB family carbohydrate kinase [Bifidobacteriaceae bacterium]|jgi:sugar/nucleoside kinase (ribokinase family)|nr:PfkB family carbohydrate kinase [Bifidobacteriaceae bacterium]